MRRVFCGILTVVLLFVAVDHIWGWKFIIGLEVRFEDFSSNEARLAFLREHGYLTDPECTPTVRQLYSFGGLNEIKEFVLIGPESGCHTNKRTVLGDNYRQEFGRFCSGEEQDDGSWSYYCSVD